MAPSLQTPPQGEPGPKARIAPAARETATGGTVTPGARNVRRRMHRAFGEEERQRYTARQQAEYERRFSEEERAAHARAREADQEKGRAAKRRP